jgi:hypothetical protein
MSSLWWARHRRLYRKETIIQRHPMGASAPLGLCCKVIAADNTTGVQEKMKLMLSAANVSGSPGEAVVDELHRPANARMHQMSIVETVRGVAPVMAGVVKQGVSEGVYHTPYPLETTEFLLASNSFFFDDAVFQWKPEELASRVQACVRIIELSLGAAEGSFQFLYDSLSPESGEDG